MYNLIHLYFLSPISNTDLFPSLEQLMCRTHNSKYIHSINELNIAFVPLQKYYFSLNQKNAYA